MCSNHINSHSFRCYKCDFESVESSEVKKHEISAHGLLKCNQEAYALNNETRQKEDIIQFKCNQCSYSIHTEEELGKHKLTHENEPVPMVSRPQRIKCDQCSYIAEDVAGFVKHIRYVHTAEHCQNCDYKAKDREDLQSHTIKDHEELVLLRTMADQVNEISGRFELFETFKEELADVIKSIAETQNAVKQELFLIRNKQAELSSSNIGLNKSSAKPDIPLAKPALSSSSSSAETHIKLKSSTPSGPPTRSSPKVTPAQSPTVEQSLPSRAPQPHSSRVTSSPRHSAPAPVEKKTLLIGDSISANVTVEALENATQSKFTTARAYSSIHDTEANTAKHAARFPLSNFADVVPAMLGKDDYQLLVLQAGSVDITNLKTKDNPSKYLEYYRQETVMSAKNLFQSAVEAISASSTLQKVLIMKHIPRYDPSAVDPLCLKPALSQLYNNTLTEEWLQSDYKDIIVIGTHNIECAGAIKEARYRETKSGKFDGIHLYGSSGRKAYTLSVLNILKSANLTSSDYDFHQSCAQFRYQDRQHRHSQQGAFRQMKGKSRNVSSQQMFSLPTANRFDGLSGLVQGN